ncbi:MAG: hypothetical protein Kow0076_2040 [Francisella sp.]
MESNSSTNKKFSLDKLKQLDEDVVDLLKLIQAVKYDRMRLQEEYNSYRLKFYDYRVKIDREYIKLKKKYSEKISALNDEYNSLKSNTIIELNNLRSKLQS